MTERHLTENRSGRNKWAAKSVNNIIEELCTNLEKGLSQSAIAGLRAKWGYNVFNKVERTSIIAMFLQQLLLDWSGEHMLILAALISLALSEFIPGTTILTTQGAAILTIVFINACVATWAEKSAGDALVKLEAMAEPKCKVIRDGFEQAICAKELVPGDVVTLLQGDAVPADIRLFAANQLLTNERLITGENLDRLKVLWPEDVDEPFAQNLCFGTTHVANGQGKGIVVATGINTEIGKITQLLKQTSGEYRKTPLEKALDCLGTLIGSLSFCVAIMIVVLAYAVDYHDPMDPASPVLALVIFGVVFAVSSIPASLPSVVKICFSSGVQNMLRRKALVRRLPALENLGACSVICADKTGTLTMGNMTCVRMSIFVRPKPGEGLDLKDKTDQAEGQVFDFFPQKGFHPNGGIFARKDLNEAKEKELIARWQEQQEANEKQDYDDILKDFGDPNGSCRNSMECKAVRGLLLASYLNSYATKLKKGEDGMWAATGDMSQAAIVTAACKARYSDPSIHGKYMRTAEAEVPFNGSRKMIATIHKLDPKDGPNKFGQVGLKLKNGQQSYTHVAVVKGALDRLRPNISPMFCNEGNEINIDDKPMSDAEKNAMNEMNIKFSTEALRVLAVCLRPLTADDMSKLSGMQWADDRLEFINQGDSRKGQLCLMGFLASIDPPRTGVKEAVQTCHRAKVRVIMITGDQRITACAVASTISIIEEGDKIEEKSLVCSHLHNDDGSFISQENIDEITRRVNVFSRATPADKIEIVKSLQRQGEVCAMIGDGINDAPALRAASIGVAMGIMGTEITKEASDMVLLDDNFCTIVSAVEEGRKMYCNIQKYVCFLLGINVGEIFYLSLSIILGLPLPVQALQILFLNWIIAGCPAVAISKEQADDDIMDKPPCPLPPSRRKKCWEAACYIMNRDCVFWVNMPHQLGITFFVLIAVTWWGRTTSFICAVLCVIMRAYTVKSTKPFYETFLRNGWMHVACTVSFCLTLIVTLIPGVQDIIQVDNPEWYCYPIAIILALGCSCNDEVAKFFFRRKLRRRAAQTAQDASLNFNELDLCGREDASAGLQTPLLERTSNVDP